eukprot:CAMPEP_0119023928 /NCGR_PEP_ID=MMETSP1176-20130426/30920_1 /TAXON_ID=265551 /ORGANISM="Synedropsis recta cf, Strain CCMP1620" /LENGTH=592 /DNA_ID=CAMNT_0006979095 /DNA_START=1 /DNA_END=1779 /DNA_ORIENTATION=+
MSRKEKQGGYLPQSSEKGPVTWDTEEDHLLSYFLGGEAHGGHGGATYTSSNHNVSITPRSHRMTPSTPQVQFYATSTKGSHPPPAAPVQSASSSSSSLSSMAATLVTGGPVLHQYHHGAHAAISSHQQQSNGMYNTTSPLMNMSPISPAATMGTPQEMLMLPPPPRHNDISKSEAERQQHIAWLNQINAMAMMNRQGQQQVPPQHQQPHLMQPPHYHSGGTAQLAPTPIFHPPNNNQQQQGPQVESEERRARRLARNRESARQSRRRKKDNLARLSKQVNGLHEAIEDERRHQLSLMEENLQKLRFQAIRKLALVQSSEDGPEAPSLAPSREGIRELLDNLGPNCAVRQNCVSFQYSALKQLMLPKYQAFILWLTLQDEDFFAAGKEQKAKNTRVSSKQIGEELTNQWKKSPVTAGNISPTNSEDATDGALQARADEAARLWPLFCFEMSISVDQEDKLLAFHKRAQELGAKDRAEMSDATKMVMNMKKGILNHCQSTVGRSENIFSGTLNPSQSAAYFKWYTDNAELLRSRPAAAAAAAAPVVTKEAVDSGNKGEISISDLCKRLTQVLTLPEETTVSMEDEPESTLFAAA